MKPGGDAWTARGCTSLKYTVDEEREAVAYVGAQARSDGYSTAHTLHGSVAPSARRQATRPHGVPSTGVWLKKLEESTRGIAMTDRDIIVDKV